ncbi:stage IV sporulation protein FB [Bacillus methanolicus]|uniref:M50 family metallopeptidase n=1 Tax=Bacillus methanolicus TaxID=1471 RepID=UPI00237FFC64|nr:M50 family metallopeptidase [Bacillus methanolicus]MDE3839763.1 stage IV sporulation protein FB [Bacillus methanolicus]
MNKIISMLSYIHIHPLLWVVIAIAVLTARFIELCLFLLIIFIHEMGHAAAASLFSWRIKKISLLPFGGVAEVEEHGNRPLMEEAAIILAGPLQHIWMMGLAFLFNELSLLPDYLYGLFIQFNFMILIFNFLPIWPLDGGKLLFLMFSLRHSFPDAHKITLLISIGSIVLFTFITLLTAPVNLNVWIVIAFLAYSVYNEWKQMRFVFIRFLLERYYGKNSNIRSLKPITVREDELVIKILERFHRGCKHPIIIEKNGKEKGTLDENELLHAYFSEKMTSAKVGDLLYTYKW